MSPIRAHALGQRFEVEFLKGAVLADSEPGVGDMKLLTAEEDVGLHAAEALLKGVEKRTFVAVVVVGMGPGQGGGFRARWERLFPAGGEWEQGSEEEESE